MEGFWKAFGRVVVWFLWRKRGFWKGFGRVLVWFLRKSEVFGRVFGGFSRRKVFGDGYPEEKAFMKTFFTGETGQIRVFLPGWESKDVVG